MMAFRGPKSLADYLVRARVNKSPEEGLQRGTWKCGSRRCEVCNYMDEKDGFVSSRTEKGYSINYGLNCNSCNVVYLITCGKCGFQYVGSTTTKIRLRFNNHKARLKKTRETQCGCDEITLYSYFILFIFFNQAMVILCSLICIL